MKMELQDSQTGTPQKSEHNTSTETKSLESDQEVYAINEHVHGLPILRAMNLANRLEPGLETRHGLRQKVV